MRRNGLEELPAAVEKRTLPRWLVPSVVLSLVVAVAVGYVLWARNAPSVVEGEVPLRPLSKSDLRGYLRASEAERSELVSLFDADDEVEALGSAGARGRDNALGKAEGVVARLRAMAAANHFTPWTSTMPRGSRVRTAAQTAAAIKRAGGRAEVYSLEIAVLAASALRAEGVDAMIADAWGFPGDRRPPDASGCFGYFVVAVYPGEVGHGTPTYFDPAGGRTTQPDRDHVRVLTDTQVVAAALATQALYSLIEEQAAPLALDLIQKAVRLDPRSPYVRNARGAILVSSGGVEEGMQELEASAQLRNDAPRQVSLAALHVAQGDLARAEREVTTALQQSPDFGGAHAILGAIRMARGDDAGAREELEAAQRLEPTLFTLPMLWAEYYLRTGDTQHAAEKAAEAVRARSHDWQTRLSAARVYRAAGMFREMRVEARAVMSMVPSDQRDAMREQVLSLLGPTALEEEDESESAVPDGGAPRNGDAPVPDVPSFDLGQGSRLLGPPEGASGSAEPSQNEPAIMMGDPSRYRLSGPSQNLQLSP